MAATQQRIISPNVAEYPPGHWSNCIRVGDAIYLSGFTSRGQDLKTIHGINDAYEQTKVIFTKVKHCLEAAGAKMSDVVNMTIFVTDIALNQDVWRARRTKRYGYFLLGGFAAEKLFIRTLDSRFNPGRRLWHKAVHVVLEERLQFGPPLVRPLLARGDPLTIKHGQRIGQSSLRRQL